MIRERIKTMLCFFMYFLCVWWICHLNSMTVVNINSQDFYGTEIGVLPIIVHLEHCGQALTSWIKFWDASIFQHSTIFQHNVSVLILASILWSAEHPPATKHPHFISMLPTQCFIRGVVFSILQISFFFTKSCPWMYLQTVIRLFMLLLPWRLLPWRVAFQHILAQDSFHSG